MSQSLSLSTDEVLKRIAAVIGVSRDYANWDDTTVSDAREIIRSGLRRFYNPPPLDDRIWQWRFLERLYQKSAEDVFETGTVAVADGTVTLSDGTWPDWAGDGVLRVDGVTLFVTSRDSDTELTVSNTSVEVDSDTEFELHRWRFPLSDDFGEQLDGFQYHHANYTRMLGRASEQEVRLRYSNTWRTGQPTISAIVPVEGVTDGTGIGSSGRGYVIFWPTMDEGGMLVSKYRSMPPDNLDDDDVRDGPAVTQVDANHAETMLQSILAAAESYYGVQGGRHEQLFLDQLASSIDHDRHYIGSVDDMNRPDIDRARFARLGFQPTYNDLVE